MDPATMVSVGIGAIFAVVMGIKKIRKWNRENKKTVIASDNKRGRDAVLERVRERLGGGKVRK